VGGLWIHTRFLHSSDDAFAEQSESDVIQTCRTATVQPRQPRERSIPLKNKRIASVGIIAGLAIGGGAGLVLSQVGGASAGTLAATAAAADDTTATTTPATGSSTPADPAAPAPDAAKPVRGAAEKTALDKLVTDGTITQAQEDAVIKALEAARPTGGPGVGGPGVGGPGGGPGGGRRGGPGGGMQFDVAAKTIGVTADELRTAVQGGQTVAAVATSKGVTPQAVIDALVAEVKTREAAQVTAGKQTQAEADAKITEATTRITTWVNSTPATAADGHGPGKGGPGTNGATPATTPASQAPTTTTA
jgi:hypothetical protein